MSNIPASVKFPIFLIWLVQSNLKLETKLENSPSRLSSVKNSLADFWISSPGNKHSTQAANMPLLAPKSSSSLSFSVVILPCWPVILRTVRFITLFWLWVCWFSGFGLQRKKKKRKKERKKNIMSFLIFCTHSQNSSTMSNIITIIFLKMKGNTTENVVSELHANFLQNLMKLTVPSRYAKYII